MSEQYKISLGVDVDVSDIQSQINSKATKIDKIPIKLEIENLKDIKKQIQSLGDTKTNKSLLTFNTESLEASLKDVSVAIKDIKASIGTLNSKSGMKSLLSTINQISDALEKTSNQFDSLNKSLNVLSGKDLNLNFGITMGGSNSPIARNAAYGNKVRNETLPQLKKQAETLEKYLDQYYKVKQKQEGIVKLTQGTNLFSDFWEMSQNIGNSKDSLANQISTYKKYISLIEDAAKIKRIDLSPVTSEFSKSAEQLVADAKDVQSGAKEMEESFEKLKQIFSGGNNLNIEGVSAQLDSIVVDLGEIKTAIQGLSSGNPLGGLTQSFDRLSETLEKLNTNILFIQNGLSTGFSGIKNIGSGAIGDIEKISDSSTDTIIQNEKKKQIAYKATTDTVLYHAGVISRLNKAETNGRFYGSNRGTGYFGTGHYFVDSATKHELDNSSYNKLPYTSIDISKYDNLFRVTSDEVGYALHSFLANLTRFTQGSDNFSVDELFAQFKNVFGDTIMDIKEFGSRLDQLKTFMSNSDFYDRSDSVSTQFMKSLGYGGVDTRGTSLADTRYGTVIYDLKEESILQANITDELQKQGQMLEKIAYEKGQVFDKDTDARIQKALDEEAKRKEIADEFENSYDTANFDKADADLTNAKNRLKEIDEAVNQLRYSLNHLDKEYQEYVRDMNSLGINDDELLLLEDEDEWKKIHSEIYQDSINELYQENAELQSKIPVLEEVYNREVQLSQEAYEQAQRVVEQRRLEAQQAQESTNVVVQSEERKQQAIKQTDDILDQQTLALMNKFSISGDKGSDAFNKIRQALVECRNELNILKNSDIGIDEEVFDTSRAVDKVTDAIANQMRAVNNLGDEYIELANYMTRFNDPAKGNKVRLPDVVKQEQGDDYRSSRGSLGIAFNTERGISFVDFINDLNHELGDTISLTNGEAAAMDELLRKVELGRKQRDTAKKSEKYLYNSLSTEEILEQNGINREEIYNDTMSAVDAVNTAERESAKVSADTTNTIVQNEERKQRAYQETRRLISDIAQDSIDNVTSKSIDRAFRVDESDSIAFRREMENLVSQWTNAKGELTDIKIDTSTIYDVDTERYIEQLRSAQVTYNNELGETIKKTIAWRQIGSEVKVVDGKEMTSPMYGFVEVSGQYSKSLGKTKVQTDAFVKQQKQAVANLTNQINQLNRAANDQNASRPIKDTSHLDALSSKYNDIISAIQRMGNATTDTFSDEQNNVKALISDFKSLVSEYKNAENVSTKMKGTDFDSGLEIARNDLEKFKAQAKDFPQIIQTIENLDNAIEGIGDASSLNKFNDQLRVARSELAKIKSETVAANRSEKVGINVSGLESKIEDLQRISPEVDKFEAEIDGAKVSVQSLLNDLKQVNTQSDFSVVNSKWKAFTDAVKAAGIAVTDTATKARTALANDIKIDIGLGNFDNEMDAMRSKFNSLSDANVDLRNSVELVENAYQEMLKVANANTGDEVADRERLIQAEKQYAAALEKTNNLIKIQARADSVAQAHERLENSHKSLELDMTNWLKRNSKATKEYGDQIDQLIISLNKLEQAGNLKQIDVNSTRSKFNLLTKDAERRGLTGLTAWDKLVDKVKEYSVYLSAADVFMYASQGLKDMFEQVKLIDSAMTELKKVTDETDASYNKFLSDAASRAKEIGTTIDGLVSSTADFARLGYSMSDAAELAEVANIYAVVGDDIDSVETATASLISTMTAFGVEASNSMSIVDKFNAVGNNFAISSGGIGEALERSASSMAAANNSLDETIALITAANTVVQDADAVGRLMPTLKMAISVKHQRWSRPRKDFISILVYIN